MASFCLLVSVILDYFSRWAARSAHLLTFDSNVREKGPKLAVERSIFAKVGLLLIREGLPAEFLAVGLFARNFGQHSIRYSQRVCG